MDRIKGGAKHGGLRQAERVIPGVTFKLDIRLRIFEGDDKDALESKVRHALELVEDDALGGSGSRGYGKVKINSHKTAE